MANLAETKASEPARDMGEEWAACVAALSQSELDRLAKWRGYSFAFCSWLHAQRLIGLYEGQIAFPVQERDRVIGWHYRVEADGSWRYYPQGTGTRPLVVGDLTSGVPVWAFESQWDALAALDACGWEEDRRLFVVVATRGASNAAKLAEIIESGSTVILWPQNDDPGQKWCKDAMSVLQSCKVKVATVPTPHKDVADWHKAGAGRDDLVQAHRDATLVLEPVRSATEGEPTHEAGIALPEPGKFPMEALPVIMRDAVATVAATYGLPPELPGMAALATLAGAIGKGAIVRGAVDDRDTHCNLFVFAGAPKSFGKGSAAKVVQGLINLSNQLGEDFRERWLPEMRGRLKVLEKQTELWASQIAKRKKGKVELTEDEIRDLQKCVTDAEREKEVLQRQVATLPSYHVGSATGAALCQILCRNNGTILSYSPEAGDMIRVALGRYTGDGKGDADLFLSGYSVEPFNEARVGRGKTTLLPCISVLWLCQPSLLRELIGNEEAYERGLTARAMIFCCEWEGPIPHDDGTPRHLDSAALEAWQAKLAAIVKLREAVDPLEITCSPEARSVFRAFYNEAVDLRNGRCRDMEAELGRWRENAVRIAGGLAVLEGAASITQDIAERAVKLARWAHVSGLAVVNAGAETRRRTMLERVISLIRDAGGEITLRVLRKNHGVLETEVEHLARLYPSRLVVEDRPAGSKGGRPSRIVRLANT
jgi:hypothetical protein